jgi:hypothetical protein
MYDRLLRSGVLVVLAACGRIGFDGTSAPNADSGSGEPRIAQRWYEFDAARSFGGFYDRQRGEPCFPVVWTDGVLRCTPTSANVFYLDAACTIPVGPTGGTVPAYFAETVVANARAIARIYTPAATTTASQVYSTRGVGPAP